MNIITIIRQRIEAHRIAADLRRKAEITSRFSVCERQGRIYLLCCGTAFAVADKSLAVDALAAAIAEARSAAILYSNDTNNTIQP